MIDIAIALRGGYNALVTTVARAGRYIAPILWFVPAILFVAPCYAAVPAATAEGPISATVSPGNPRHDYPFFATDLDLAGAGYVEEEYFLSGNASTYATPTGATGSVIDTGIPYKTRIVVRRRLNPTMFNGVVILEWYNVTPGYDNEYLWLQSGAHFMRAGYAYAAVSTQAVGFGSGVTGVDRLRSWSPARYGSLDVTQGGRIGGDALSYDIFAQAAQALRSGGDIRPLGDLKPRMILATGESQSAARLTTYVNSVHPMHHVIDALLLQSGGADLLRNDLDIPVFKVLTESDLLIAFPTVLNKVAVRQPDTDRIRIWEVAGNSHSDWQFYLAAIGHMTARELGPQPPDASCDLPSRSHVPVQHVLNAAYDHLVRWTMQGVLPPTAPRIEAAGAPERVVRDELGNARGGIRLAAIAAPIAMESGHNSATGPSAVTCALRGAHVPFSNETLEKLYPSHEAYVNAVREATERNVKSGYVLEVDGQQSVEAARASVVGRRLRCGPLCQTSGAGMDSIAKLRDQTAYFEFGSNRGKRLVASLNEALRQVAEGDTLNGSANANAHYSLAIRSLTKYLLDVNDYKRSGLIQEWTAHDLIGAAQVLISKIDKTVTGR